MDDKYLLFSVRLGGWQTSGGAYTSEVAQAKRVDRKEAVAMCKRQLGAGGLELGLVPVPLNIVDEIRHK